jgi:hypothetical protein
MYGAQIELGHQTLIANRRVRAQAADLRAEARGLRRLRSTQRRLLQFAGGSGASGDDRVRSVLRDVASKQTPRLFASYSRGSVCQACGNVVNAGVLEYEAVTTESSLLLDAACYRILIQHLRGDAEYGTRDVVGS